MSFERAVLIVIDGFGVGELPDAHLYGDEGSHTLDNTAKAAGGLKLENLTSLGLGLIEGVTSIEKVERPLASYGRMKEASPGKDTVTGHWEMMGIVLQRPFATFPAGFPPEIMEKFTERTGYGYIWGRPASGTEIIKKYGEEHLRTGKLIVYTSADSVFQIAAHEDRVPVPELYRICGIAREVVNEYNVERVIARPFVGSPGNFVRTERRKDFSMEPPEETLLDRLKKRSIPVVGVGKIGDIFAGRGLSKDVRTKNDHDGIVKTLEAIKEFEGKKALIYVDLVDLDTLYGHRNNPQGSKRCLQMIDERVPEITGLLTDKDVLIITGDHGNDPTTPSTDHSREYTPLLVWGKGFKGVDLGTRATFADIGASLAGFFGIEKPRLGTSFLPLLSDT